MSEGKVAASMEARRRRRHEAGQSGGQFEIVRHGSAITYRYVWPDKETSFVDRLVSWACAKPTEGSVKIELEKTPTHDAEAETKRDNPDKEVVAANRSNIVKTANDKDGRIDIMTSGKETGKARRAIRRLNRRMSGWLQGKKDDSEEDGRMARGRRAQEQDQSRISKSQPLCFGSENPIKERLVLEADREFPFPLARRFGFDKVVVMHFIIVGAG